MEEDLRDYEGFLPQNKRKCLIVTHMNWAQVGVVIFVLGTAVLGTGAAATIASGTVSGAVAGQAARATENVLRGQAVTVGLGDAGPMVADAVLGGVLAGAGYGLGRLAQTGVAEAARDTAVQEAQSLIDGIVRTELKNVRLSHYPQYDPAMPLNQYGEALPGRYTRIGPLAIEAGRRETLVTIVHEEMHHRVYARGWRMPLRLEEAYVERVAQRFVRMKGW